MMKNLVLRTILATSLCTASSALAETRTATPSEPHGAGVAAVHASPKKVASKPHDKAVKVDKADKVATKSDKPVKTTAIKPSKKDAGDTVIGASHNGKHLPAQTDGMPVSETGMPEAKEEPAKEHPKAPPIAAKPVHDDGTKPVIPSISLESKIETKVEPKVEKTKPAAHPSTKSSIKSDKSKTH